MSKYFQGKYQPKKPEKYVGDPTKIFFRSSWELRILNWLDSCDSVLKYTSEEVIIPYISPVDGKWHRYFVDFGAIIKDVKGVTKNILIEVKPKAQTEPPKFKGRQTRRYLSEASTYMVNQSKWEAAREWCKKNGYEFMIFTEKEIFNK